jgi:hypothetical protein
MVLATFIQISDLHVGIVTDPSSMDARMKAWMRWPVLDGLLGHSGMSLRNLRDFMKDIRRERPEARLIVTGDLTTRGDKEEYETADDFLRDMLRPPRGTYVGLGLKDWCDDAISGNHDNWPGIDPPPPTELPMLGPSGLDLKSIFPGVPGMSTPITLSTGHTLQFLRIDTDHDIDPNGLDRIMARGQFVSQLDDLELQLAKPAKNEIRILCLHHSSQFRGRNRLFPVLEINKKSRNRLYAFLEKHRVSILLCGHIHRPPGFDVFKTSSGLLFPKKALEIRCGTTTQVDLSLSAKPAFLKFRLFLKPYWPNTLVLHEVVQEQQKIFWKAQFYVEDPENGFEPAPATLNGVSTTSSFPVWP